MPFDAQLLQIGADDGESGDLWNACECCSKLAKRGGFILEVEIAFEKKFGQEFGLVAGWIKVQPSPFYDRVDNSLTAVAHQCNGILATTLQRENQRGGGYCDDDPEGDGQRDAYGNTSRKPRRCCFNSMGPSIVDA